MASEPLGTLVVLVYLGAVALSLPATAAVLLAARRLGVARAGVMVGAVALLFVAAAAFALGATVGPIPSLIFAAFGAAAVTLLWALPVLVGQRLVRRYAGVADDLALGYAVAGLPVAMAASAVVFVAPGGPTRYNLTFVTGPVLWVVAAAFLAIVVLGPGIVGVGLVRLARRAR